MGIIFCRCSAVMLILVLVLVGPVLVNITGVLTLCSKTKQILSRLKPVFFSETPCRIHRHCSSCKWILVTFHITTTYWADNNMNSLVISVIRKLNLYKQLSWCRNHAMGVTLRVKILACREALNTLINIPQFCHSISYRHIFNTSPVLFSNC